MSDDTQARAELYLRAERPVRALFSTYFDRLCAACGQASAERDEHLCCCIGVRCLDHLAGSPVLTALLEASAENTAMVADLRSHSRHSVLGLTGCRLDWGRPAACNVCICTPERTCLLAVMPAQEVLAFCQALRAFHLIAQPALRNLRTVEEAVEELERQVEAVVQAIEKHREAFESTMDGEVTKLRTRGLVRPEF